MKPKVGVVVFPGVNCDMDVYYVLTEVMGVDARYVWHTEGDISDLSAVILPGGFSYGDYLRAGAIARFSTVMKEIYRFAKAGKPVLGICNGFQILVESKILPGAFLKNKTLTFICKPQYIRVENPNTIFTKYYKKGETLIIPIAHAEGNYYVDPDTYKYLEDNEMIAFRYSNNEGEVNEDTNPNGSVGNIAGIFNETKNVLGMMPHPERASETILGSTDGYRLFKSLLDSLL